MKTVYLMRHAITEMNSQKLIQGSSDVSLSKEGIQSVYELCDEIRSLGIEGILTSDLKRAYETGEIIGNELGVSVYRTSFLRERDFGEFEGQSVEDIGLSNVEFFFVKDAKGKESIKSLINRVREFLKYIDKNIDWTKFLVVSHNGYLRTLSAMYLKDNIAIWENCDYIEVVIDEGRLQRKSNA